MTIFIATCPTHGREIPHNITTRIHRAAKIEDDFIEITANCPRCNSQLEFKESK